MLVYGDMERMEDAAAVRAAIRQVLAAVCREPPGLARHALLVEAFILAGELVQGIADAEWETRGLDAASPAQQAGLVLVRALAELVGFSWENGFRLSSGETRATRRALDGFGPSGTIAMRQTEGFAIYALYPETYWEAARQSALGPGTRVIGIRSIGLPLAAVVASALSAANPVTLRPTGHPFARRVAVAPALRRDLLADRGATFAVVDEGPGLSGSSFAAVATLLRGGGVGPRRIHFFPSHANGPGPEASTEARASWAESPHVVRSFENTIRDGRAEHQRLDGWVAALLGTLDAPLEEIGGGGWRDHVPGGNALPCDARLERRKFLARRGGERFLVKFAGLGAAGRRKFEAARSLHQAGFCAEPLGLCHGMLVERWIERGSVPVARSDLLARLGSYLGFRAAQLPAVNRGADLIKLCRMACHNTGEALGPQEAAALRAFFARGAASSDGSRPINTDNRLHRWEWLTGRDGAVLKTDALDHSSGHDLVGCQDIAWDVAGAIAEFDLGEEEAAALCTAVGEVSRRKVDQGLVALLLPSYLAFQLGLWTTAGDAAGPAEIRGVKRELSRYRNRLAGWVGQLKSCA